MNYKVIQCRYCKKHYSTAADKYAVCSHCGKQNNVTVMKKIVRTDSHEQAAMVVRELNMVWGLKHG